MDQALLAHALAELIARRGDCEVCGTSRTPRACIELAPVETADIVLFDLRESAHPGLEWIADLRRAAPGVRVLLMREYLSPDYSAAALHAGVDGVLVRTADPTELFLALDALRRGRGFLSPSLGMPSSSPDTGSPEGDAQRIAAVDALGPVERRVLVELALGHSTVQLAEALQISLDDATEVAQRVRESLECESAADLTRLAILSGVFPLDRD